MFWLIYCGFFVLMLLGIFRMLNRRGKQAWILFVGLIASVAAYVGLFLTPVISSAALQQRPAVLISILAVGTVGYVALVIVFIRRSAAKLAAETPQGKP